MTHATDLSGPVSISSETHVVSDDVQQAVSATLAKHPAGPTLIDQMSDEDFLSGEDGDITVGKVKAA